jgi:SM-20-related protein
MGFLDLEAFRRAPLTRSPFTFTVVPNILVPGALAQLKADFPVLAHPGLYPVEAAKGGPSFAALIEELSQEAVARAFSEKFEIDLVSRPLMITVRGRCQEKDGAIHTDTAAKLVTALLYLNEPWEAEGGRLRLLRGPSDLDDMIGEVPPEGGTLIAFRRSDASFHGHKPYSGVRRYVMFNWMANTLAARREIARHRLSAGVKRIFAPSGY